MFVCDAQKNCLNNVQCSPFIMLYLGSMGIDCVITESCYIGTFLQRKNRKMTIKWSFSYNSFVKFNGKKIWEPQHDHVISKSVLIKGMF